MFRIKTHLLSLIVVIVDVIFLSGREYVYLFLLFVYIWIVACDPIIRLGGIGTH
jgi:hypothetical protein